MSRISNFLDVNFPLARIGRRLSKLASQNRAPISVRVEQDDQAGTHGVFLRRVKSEIVIGCDLASIRQDPARIMIFGRRPASLVRTLADANPDVSRLSGWIDDECGSGTVGFSSNADDAILVPDPFFFNSGGYEPMRRHIRAHFIPWLERNDAIIWRGAMHGHGRGTDAEMSSSNHELLARTRLCLSLRNVPGTDAKFAETHLAAISANERERLEDFDLVGKYIPTTDWGRNRFALDIDGFSNAWSNFFERLLLGCCIIKVQSERGFRQWYYEDLVAWRHFVPVRADLSDLHEQIDWCLSHAEQCEAIAAEGQKLALRMTFDHEVARGVHAFNQAHSAASSILRK